MVKLNSLGKLNKTFHKFEILDLYYNKNAWKNYIKETPPLAYYSYEKDLTILIPFSRKFALNTITYCLRLKRDEFILPKNMHIAEILKLKRYLQYYFGVATKITILSIVSGNAELRHLPWNHLPQHIGFQNKLK